MFNQDDDDITDGPKKRKLEPLDYSQEERAALDHSDGLQQEMPTRPTTAEEKRKCIKVLIEKIPTAKEELFAYTLDWNMVDTVRQSILAGSHYLVVGGGNWSCLFLD